MANSFLFFLCLCASFGSLIGFISEIQDAIKGVDSDEKQSGQILVVLFITAFLWSLFYWGTH